MLIPIRIDNYQGNVIGFNQNKANQYKGFSPAILLLMAYIAVNARSKLRVLGDKCSKGKGEINA